MMRLVRDMVMVVIAAALLMGRESREPQQAEKPAVVPQVTRARLRLRVDGLCRHGICCHVVEDYRVKLDAMEEEPFVVVTSARGEIWTMKMKRSSFEALWTNLMRDGIWRVYQADEPPPIYLGDFDLEVSNGRGLEWRSSLNSLSGERRQAIFRRLLSVPEVAALVKRLEPSCGERACHAGLTSD